MRKKSTRQAKFAAKTLEHPALFPQTDPVGFNLDQGCPRLHNVVALVMIAICVLVAARGLLRPGPINIFTAVLALFTMGYYGLPMLLIERTPLLYAPERELFSVIFMALLYLIAVLIGIELARGRREKGSGLRFPILDQYLERYWWAGLIISNGILLAYFGMRTVTFYQADNADAFYATRSSIEGILGFAAGMLQAFSAIYVVRAIQAKIPIRIVVACLGIAMQMALVLNAGQRLVLITPVLLVCAAMVAARAYRTAGITLVGLVALLLIVSPFAVAVRSGAWSNSQDIAAKNFTYGENPFDSMLQSIVDRGDILFNMNVLKSYVDARGYVGPQYYVSVLAIPIPRAVFSAKPYPLSDNGKMEGEASILAWQLVHGRSTGSLTAFGAIVAYREAGWIGVILNGLAVGALMASLLRYFVRGGMLGHAFFCTAFSAWCVRKVPPSFFEVMADVMTYLPVLLVFAIISRFLSARAPDDETSGGARAAAAPLPA